MIFLLLLILYNIQFLYTSYIYDDQDNTQKSYLATLEDLDFEPIVTEVKENQLMLSKNLNCEDFKKYAMDCTLQSALIYNSSRKSPPMPAKMHDWCRAIRYLTNCAIDWNSDCKDVAESHFHEESIRGHMHVVSSICDDEIFLSRYDELSSCIDKASNAWESCYQLFKRAVDYEKNCSQEWTHYAVHFRLCCARTQFRRCTLDVLFQQPSSKCPREQALVLQKFSVVVSEGDVFQNCDHNVMYTNCPGGNPRPTSEILSKLMSAEVVSVANVARTKQFKDKISYLLYFKLMLLIVLLNF